MHTKLVSSIQRSAAISLCRHQIGVDMRDAELALWTTPPNRYFVAVDDDDKGNPRVKCP